MKKFCKIICLCFVFLLSGKLMTMASNTYESPEYMAKKRELSMPYTETRLMKSINNDAVSVSNQIYDNVKKISVDLFRITDEGIKNINPWKVMTDEELDYVKNVADEITEDCTSVDEIIKTTAEYIAANTCYDYDYVNEKKNIPTYIIRHTMFLLTVQRCVTVTPRPLMQFCK